jgi:hypothetical protein
MSSPNIDNIEVGDLVVYKNVSINHFKYNEIEGKIGVVKEIYSRDVFAGKDNDRDLFVKMAKIFWSNGEILVIPVILLEKCEDV